MRSWTLVTLTVVAGCISRAGGPVDPTGGLPVGEPPVAVINASPTRGPNPLVVSFQSAGSYDPDGRITDFQWDFQYDGRTFDVMATGPTAQYTYFIAGTYVAALRVIDDRGNVDIDFLTITVQESNQQPPIANALARVGNSPPSDGPIAAPLGTPVEFFGQGLDPDGGEVSFLWDFGDGTQSTDQNPTHVFTEIGSYLVKLTVTDDEFSSAQDEIQVNVFPPGNLPPLVEAEVSVDGIQFQPGPVTANPGQLLFFRATAVDPEGGNVSLEWQFGDGIQASGSLVQHVFANPGSYTVLVVATDSQGAQASDSILVEVVPSGTPTALALASLDGSFYQETDISGPAPLTVYFRGVGSDPQGQPLTFLWNFGDGTPEVEGEEVTHTFTSNGTYLVTLRVRNPQGRIGLDTIGVIVNAAPVARITVDTSTGEAPLTVQFSGLNSFDPDGQIVDYEWDFLYEPPTFDIMATGPTATFTFDTAGTYLVGLRVRDDMGAESLATQAITVVGNLPPTAVIRTNPDPPFSPDLPFTVLFDGSESFDPDGQVVSWQWDFDYDGTTFDVDAEGPQVAHTFTVKRIYRVALLVADDLGATDQAEVQVNAGGVIPRPPVIRNWSPIEVVVTQEDSDAREKTVNFQVEAFDPDGGPVQVIWDFGDGNQGLGTRVSHTYDLNYFDNPNDPNFLAGNFLIRIQAVDDEGDSSEVEFLMVMSPILPPAMIGMDPAPAVDFTLPDEFGGTFQLLTPERQNKVITLHFCYLALQGNPTDEMPLECQFSDQTLSSIWEDRDLLFGTYSQDYEQYFISLDNFSAQEVQAWRGNHPGLVQYTILMDRDADPLDGIFDVWKIYKADPPWGDGDPDVRDIPLTVVLDRNGFVRGWIDVPIIDVAPPGAPPGIDSFSDLILHFLKIYQPPA